MCGLAGFYHLNSNYDRLTVIQRMALGLYHRGPDDEGQWFETAGIALGHRRLAILDLSDHGRQPMHSHSGRFVLVFNGECYNFQAIRAELDKIQPKVWRGHSDTEVVLEAIEQWGIQETLKKMVGMFAFALWDQTEKELYLARDRMGEKPLYFGWSKGALLFASELSALKEHPSFQGDLNPEAVEAMIRYGYVPGHMSIYQGITKVKPGCSVRFTQKYLIDHLIPDPEPYWSLTNLLLKPHCILEDKEAVDLLEKSLLDAVQQQMISDVPLGAFLSGGVDSSTIVALMQKQSLRPIQTFSIGFEEAGFNEAPYAKAVAAHLKTDHTELYVTNQDALEVIPKLSSMYSEPFGDSSQIPTYLVSQLARQKVTVSLSGDAGDELFAGYTRYHWVNHLWRRIGWLPYSLRQCGAGLLKCLPIQPMNALGKHLPKIPSHLGDKIHKFSNLLPRSHLEIYKAFITQWQDADAIVHQANHKAPFFPAEADSHSASSFLEQMMYLDALSYLSDDILVKVDRAAMANSLETRVPLLDHRVVELAWSLPIHQKVRGGVTKWALRQVLYRYVPKSLIERPKQGFGIPIQEWLRGPLKEWADDLLSTHSLNQTGLLNVDFIQERWQEHLSGKRNWQYGLWNVLMFQGWLQSNKIFLQR